MICILKTHWVLGGAERYLSDLSSVLTAAGQRVLLASLDALPRPEVLDDLLRRSGAVRMERWPLDRGELRRRTAECGIFISAVPSLVLWPSAEENWLVVFTPGAQTPQRWQDRARLRVGRATRGAMEMLSRSGIDVGTGARFAFHPYRAPAYAVKPYRRIIAISDFVGAGVRAYWGVDSIRIYPGVDLPERAEARRSRSILAVGRFNPSGNAKHHSTLIDAFRLLHNVDDRWNLHLVGGYEGSDAERRYMQALQCRAAGLPITFHANATEAHLSKLLQEASFFWHAAGVESCPGDYYTVEQFGIAVAEAAANGVVPLVFPAGGVREIVPSGAFTWVDAAQLAAATSRISESDGLWTSMSAAARSSAQRFSRDRFRGAVEQLLAQARGRVLQPERS